MIRRLGSWLLFAEAAGFIGAVAWFGYELVTAHPRHPVAAVFESAIFLAFAAVLILAARHLTKGGRSGRTPALLINLIALPISYYLWQSGRWAIATPLAAAALFAIIALLSAEK